tara:strand:- start:1035 stop:2240 length:1206 start_codon:yes stop_codon:yes gene_type:complete
MNDDLKNCLVCRSVQSVPFFDGGSKPLALVGWPASKKEAVDMSVFPLRYVQCIRCSHIWNKDFKYENIPYKEKPNRMFNSGKYWKEYLQRARSELMQYLPENPTVIDIGCGEGHFIRDLATLCAGSGTFVGFDPNVSGESGRGIEFIPGYFHPNRDVQKFAPDLIVMRHVLEHLTEPTTFIEQLAISAVELGKPIYFFAETPCIDLAIENQRAVDFYYEHPSQFTEKSFEKMMVSGGDLLQLGTAYGKEVVSGIIQLGLSKNTRNQKKFAEKFFHQNEINVNSVKSQFRKLSKMGDSAVIWGGVGKAATFIQHYDLTEKTFPIVVDSDEDKVGTFVPGMGQLIQSPSILQNKSWDLIFIPSQWRARDIVSEIKERRIKYSRIIVEFKGQLVDFERGEHPYR